MNLIWKLKNLREDINSHNSHRLVMEDELFILQNKQVTLKSKLIKLQEDLKNNESLPDDDTDILIFENRFLRKL